MDETPLGPGVIRRRKALATVRLDEAPEVTHRREKSQEAERLRPQVEELLALWANEVGPTHHLLPRHMKAFLREFGLASMREDILEAAARLRAAGRGDAWHCLCALTRVLRERRRHTSR